MKPQSLKAALYSTRLQVSLGACGKYDVIAVLAEFRFESMQRRFAWRCARHFFFYFPRSSASEDARVLGDSSQTCTSVPAFVWNKQFNVKFKLRQVLFDTLTENNA